MIEIDRADRGPRGQRARNPNPDGSWPDRHDRSELVLLTRFFPASWERATLQEAADECKPVQCPALDAASSGPVMRRTEPGSSPTMDDARVATGAGARLIDVPLHPYPRGDSVRIPRRPDAGAGDRRRRDRGRSGGPMWTGRRPGAKVPARREGIGPRPWFGRIGSVANDGGDRAMDANSASIESEGLAACFSRLWEKDLPIPDVFAFLSERPAVPAGERLEVLLEDQHQRWLRGQPLPLRVYLSAFPDIAERGEFIRALVDRERQERRKSAGRLNDTLDNPTPSAILSESETIAVEVESSPVDTQADPSSPYFNLSPTGPIPISSGGLKVTRDRASDDRTGDRDELDFALDDNHHLYSEAERLKVMLNAVRFTLVRRLGTGGMGVVYRGVRPAARGACGPQDDATGRSDGPGPVQARVPRARAISPIPTWSISMSCSPSTTDGSSPWSWSKGATS